MASPPYSATSPPGPSPLALPRQRPTLALPTGAVKSRKPSIASNASSAHPLRQTSFPPAESLGVQHAAAQQFSPTGSGFEDDFSDSEIVSAISGPAGAPADVGTGKKRKGGGGKGGRPKKKRAGSESVLNGEDRSTPATRKNAAAAAEEEEDDAGDEETDARGGRIPAYEGAQMSAAEWEQDEKHRAMFMAHMKNLDDAPLSAPGRKGITRRDFEQRYHTWHSAKLRSADVRRLVNQTVGQSVPQPVVLAVQAYTKLFAGMIVEGARRVQGEWMGVEGERADGEGNEAWKRLRRAYLEGEGLANGEAVQTDGGMGANGALHSDDAQTNGNSSEPNGIPQSSSTLNSSDPVAEDEPPLYPGGASALQSSIDECDRGPLLPDHLREALRRYKKAHRGGAVGFTGYSLEGKTGTAAKMGGRRLFR